MNTTARQYVALAIASALVAFGIRFGGATSFEVLAAVFAVAAIVSARNSASIDRAAIRAMLTRLLRLGSLDAEERARIEKELSKL